MLKYRGFKNRKIFKEFANEVCFIFVYHFLICLEVTVLQLSDVSLQEESKMEIVATFFFIFAKLPIDIRRKPRPRLSICNQFD